jgi:hypothetical protein
MAPKAQQVGSPKQNDGRILSLPAPKAREMIAGATRESPGIRPNFEGKRRVPGWLGA